MAKEELLELQKDAYGIIMTFKTSVDMTNTTSLLLRIRRSDQTYIEKDLGAGNILNPSIGEVAYTVEDGDLTVSGQYHGQIIDNTPSKYLPSKKFKFRVLENV